MGIRFIKKADPTIISRFWEDYRQRLIARGGSEELSESDKAIINGSYWELECDKHNPPHRFTRFLAQGTDTSTVTCPLCEAQDMNKKLQDDTRLMYENQMVETYGVPADNVHATFDTFEIRRDDPDPTVAMQDEAALDAMRELARPVSQITKLIMLRTVLLCGVTGSGKSFLGSALVNEVKHNGRKLTIRYIADSTLLSMASKNWKKKDDSADQMRKLFESYDLLIVDDWNPDRWNAANSTFSYDLFIERYNNLKQTAVLTNRSPIDVKTAVGSAVWSRFQRGRVIILKGEDRRKKQKQEQGGLYES